jgi:hypothetical protein
MILKHDEQSVLLAIAGSCESLEGIPQMRIDSIVSRLRAHGMIHANGDPTSRGLHVASKLTPTKQETAPDGDIHGQPESDLEPQSDGTIAEKDQGISLDRVDEPGIGPDAEASERSDGFGRSGLSDL